VFVLAAVSANRRNTLNTNANVTIEGQLRSRRKAAKMLVAVVIMFAGCYFPVHMLSILRYVEMTDPSVCNRIWLVHGNRLQELEPRHTATTYDLGTSFIHTFNTSEHGVYCV
jgi:hypothetical protein